MGAAGRDAALLIAARNRFTLAGLRAFSVRRTPDEGSTGVRISLDTATYAWR
jgi:hypothetical protein